jgi:hypothetical protein
LHKKQPAALAGPPASKSKSSQHQRGLDSEVQRPGKPIFAPAKLRPAPDDRGESDLAFFTARPNAKHRIRSAFAGEFPRRILKQGRGRPAVVIVTIERDASGRPTRRARGLVFPNGGSA